jgi:hypothetical protein
MSVGLPCLLFSNSALYGGAVIIFAEPAVECVTFTTCSELEGSGLRLAARSGLLGKAIAVSEVDAVGLS